MSLATIAEAVWTESVRTLTTGSPPAPVTRADYIAKAVWEYATRTLTVLDPQLINSTDVLTSVEASTTVLVNCPALIYSPI